MEDAEILVFEKGPHVSFANCGLPYYVSGEISDKDKLVVQSPESLYDRFGLDIRVESEVVEIDPDQKIVKVAGFDGVYTETYDKLILSPGAEPIVPDLKGLDQADNAFTLRNIPDLKAIMQELDQEKVQEAVVIGAGFIGLKMVENLVKRGIKVSLVEMADQVLPTLDPEMASFVEAELKDKGVNVLTGRSA